MMTIEERVLDGIWALLLGDVNEALVGLQRQVALFERRRGGSLGGFGCQAEVALLDVERTEKERFLKIDAFTVTVEFAASLPDCYVYAWALDEALRQDATLGGLVDNVVFVSRRYLKEGPGNNAQFKLRVIVESGK